MPRSASSLRGEPRIDRCRAQPVEVFECHHRRLLRHGGLERARAEAEPQQLLDLDAALLDEVEPGDAAVDGAVLDVLRDVGRADEEHVDRRVPARERERALARLLGPEAGVVEQRDGGLAQPPLDGDGDPQAV